MKLPVRLVLMPIASAALVVAAAAPALATVYSQGPQSWSDGTASGRYRAHAGDHWILPSNGCVLPRGATLPWRSVVREFEELCGPDGCEGDVMLLEPHAGAIAEVFRLYRNENEHTTSSLRNVRR